MEWNVVAALVGGAVMFVGSISVVYQIYHMTFIDAKARGLKHPKFWGFFTMSGNNSGNLIVYLIGRRKYPIIDMSQADKNEIERRKKAAGAGLVFLAVGAIALVWYIV